MTTTGTQPVAVVTGASAGIGQATAVLLARQGYRVAGLARTKGESRDQITYYQTDLAIVEQIQAAFSRIADDFGRVDILINNAALQVCKPFLELSPEDWDMTHAINVRAIALAAVEAIKLMPGGVGSIVNVASVHSLATAPNIAAYAASKGAVLALTRAMAIELAPHIRVNAVLPGAVDTAMLTSGFERSGDPQAARDYLEKQTVMGRIGKPEEIGEAILFLSDNRRSSFITGQSLVVDGGALARLSTE